MSIAIASIYFDTTGDADAIAAKMPDLTAYLTATDQQKANPLIQACVDIDRGERWQGRMFVFDQGAEFPRAAFDSSRRSLVGYGPVGPAGFGIGDTVWDWDYTNNVAIVPNNVYLAILYQADSYLQNFRFERLDSIHDGVRSQGVGSVREEYGIKAGNEPVLCRKAWKVMKRYMLTSGRMM